MWHSNFVAVFVCCSLVVLTIMTWPLGVSVGVPSCEARKQKRMKSRWLWVSERTKTKQTYSLPPSQVLPLTESCYDITPLQRKHQIENWAVFLIHLWIHVKQKYLLRLHCAHFVSNTQNKIWLNSILWHTCFDSNH